MSTFAKDPIRANVYSITSYSQVTPRAAASAGRRGGRPPGARPPHGEGRRLGHITADGEPNGDGREPALEHRRHRTLTGRDDDAGRAERLNCVPHDHVRAAGLL